MPPPGAGTNLPQAPRLVQLLTDALFAKLVDLGHNRDEQRILQTDIYRHRGNPRQA